MNKYCCRSFILSLVIPSVLLLSDAVHANKQGVEVLSSSEKQCLVRIDTDWSRLYREPGRDSSTVVFTTVTVGIPYGAAVSVVRSNGLDLVPIPDKPGMTIPIKGGLPLVAQRT